MIIIKTTYKYILSDLNITKGQEITLDELDDNISKISMVTTQMGDGYGTDEVLEDENYTYYYNENDEIANVVYFEVVNNTGSSDSIVRII